MKTLKIYNVTDSSTSRGYEIEAKTKKEAIKKVIESNLTYKSESLLNKYTYCK